MPFHWFGKVSFVPYTKVSEFAEKLKDGKLTGTKCRECGNISFPPRADCIECMAPDFEWVEYRGDAVLHTYTVIHAAPTGFDEMAPYIIGIADLPEGGRILGWMRGVEKEEVRIGMALKVVPRMFEEIPEIKVYYTLERADGE